MPLNKYDTNIFVWMTALVLAFTFINVDANGHGPGTLGTLKRLFFKLGGSAKSLAV
jgi:hypothetical protein